MIKEELFQDFIGNRADIKKPMTQRAVKMLRKRLHELYEEGYCPNKCMERAIRNGWQDVWPHDSCKVKQVGFIEKHTNRDWATKTQSVPFVELHTNRKWREGL